MTTIARGIILSGDLGKLVIEASDREVEQFANRQLVEVTALGPRPRWDTATVTFQGEVANRGSMYFYGPAWVDVSSDLASDDPGWTSELRAHLDRRIASIIRTRCGCSKIEYFDIPPPPTYSVVLEQHAAMRTFDFIGIDHDHPRRRMRAIYEEQA